LTINLFLKQVTYGFLLVFYSTYSQLIRSSTETKQMAIKVEVSIAAWSKE